MSEAASDFWAVTTYFNPAGYERRRLNYGLFRKHLKPPLLTVELAFDGDFELEPGDAEILVHLRGGDVMWQKERLLNIAIGKLPPSCAKVAWLDCDVVFEDDDWAARATEQLEEFPLVQPFSHVHLMSREWLPGREPPTGCEVVRSPVFMLARVMSLAECLGQSSFNIVTAPGYAWAARRELFDGVGLYDACIVGGGDSALARAAYGRFDDAVRQQLMNLRRRSHFLEWAALFYDRVRGEVAYLDGALRHLWHGSRADRRYKERVQRLETYAFDPWADISAGDKGAWCWSSAKPAMHDYVRSYFASRREDG
jgi:hypothetical protein